MTRGALTLAIVVASCAVAGCAPHATEAILTIASADLQVPGDLDSIHIETRPATGAGQIITSADVTLCSTSKSGCQSFPFTVLFVPGDHADVPARVDVIARDGATDVVHDAFLLTFVPDTTLRFELILYRACKQTTCSAVSETCGAQGQCMPLATDGGPDLGSGNAFDLIPGDFMPVPRRVFLGSAHNGNLNGRAGADMLCNNVAAMHAWSTGGRYASVLATSADEPINTILLNGHDRKIIRADGKQVATDDTFWSPHHLAPIDLFADGTALAAPGDQVWTGFDSTGHRTGGNSPVDFCNDWTDGSGASAAPFGAATDTGGPGSPWASITIATSSDSLAVYCIEQ